MYMIMIVNVHDSLINIEFIVCTWFTQVLLNIDLKSNSKYAIKYKKKILLLFQINFFDKQGFL